MVFIAYFSRFKLLKYHRREKSENNCRHNNQHSVTDLIFFQIKQF